MKLISPTYDFQALRRLRRCRAVAQMGDGRWEMGDGRGQRGVALVITLVLLAIITFMAIAFLVLSRSQTQAVVGSTDQTLARLAADSALERARAEVLASIMASRSEFAYDLSVSTNYISGAGFINSGLAYGNVTNVGYAYPNGQAIDATANAADFCQNIANLMYNPRAPVFITTNRNQATPAEFRYYLDLNRNGRPETNGLQPVINLTGGFYGLDGTPVPWSAAPGNVLSNFFAGDPEWIGNLEFPDRPHSPANRFISRYAYLVVPIGKTLDLNYVHNYAKRLDLTMATGIGDGLVRDQGVGTWEDNLAAFLVDLNTNMWPFQGGGIVAPNESYNYLTNLAQANTGLAFDDALSLLRYRYGAAYNSLFSVSQLFGATGISAFGNDLIDGYTAPNNLPTDPDIGRTDKPWSGSYNTNHYFSTQELYDRSKTAIGIAPAARCFSDRLAIACANTNSYDRYTFYRLLSQLGTDSAPEPAGTMNINYDNLCWRNADGIISATNFQAWDATTFFTNAALRLLKSAGYTEGNGYTNLLLATSQGTAFQIPIYPYNYYTPSVHRLMQLAANIYDATTKRTYGTTAEYGFPTVFRPLFRKAASGQVFIVGYREVVGTALAFGPAPKMVQLDIGVNTNAIFLLGKDIQPAEEDEALVAGCPLVIGAKKGFPTFNEFGVLTRVDLARRLEFRKPDPQHHIRQMYNLSISNAFGLEAWNSFNTAYPRPLRMITTGNITTTITNAELPTPLFYTNTYPLTSDSIIPAGMWSGFDDINYPAKNYTKYSFCSPLNPTTSNGYILSNACYFFGNNTFVPANPVNWDAIPENQFPVARFYIKVRTDLRYILVDTQANRIVDYVNLVSNEEPVDMATVLTNGYATDGDYGSMWLTNRAAPNGSYDTTGMTRGITNQISVNLGIIKADWQSAGEFVGVGTAKVDSDGALNFFRTNFLNLGPTNRYFTGGAYRAPLTPRDRFYAPFAPMRTTYLWTSWQANDPLVHYTTGDLLPAIRTNNCRTDLLPDPAPVGNIGGVIPGTTTYWGTNTPMNSRYEPWGYILNGSTNAFQLALKDPLVGRSSDWSFPTNKFPNPGWLGAVHRGTPWQTVYLKAAPVDLASWQVWSGNAQVTLNQGQLDAGVVRLGAQIADAALTMPINDRRLLDIFSTGLNDNANRGKLNINQSGLAAWSAVLSGVRVRVNTIPDATLAGGSLYVHPDFASGVVDPAGIYNPFDATVPSPAVVRIVNAINAARATNNPARPVFDHLGDILSVPELTVGANPGCVGTQVRYINNQWSAASPFLNLGDPSFTDQNSPGGSLTYQQTRGLDDEAYESLPRQILGLLTCDHTPRLVVYAWGQALKPANNSTVIGGPYFGLCTNYQITAESAIRAVVRIEGAPANPRAVIESFNTLPPD